MGLFDKDLATCELIPQQTGVAKTTEALFNQVVDRDNLEDDEANALKQFYNVNLSGEGLVSFLPLLMSRGGVKVEISQNRPTSPYIPGSNKPDHPIDPFGESGTVLGEYDPCEDTIVLYINAIRAFSSSQTEKPISPADMLLYVFAHELYHAYFHKDKYIPELEEPLAEFGALLYMNTYYSHNTNDEERENIMRTLFSISESNKIECYKKGAELFRGCNSNPSLPLLIEYFRHHDIKQTEIQDSVRRMIKD